MHGGLEGVLVQEVRSEEVVDVSRCEGGQCIRGIYIIYRKVG